MPFRPPSSLADEPEFEEVSRNKLFSTCIYGICLIASMATGTNMRKAAHPSGGMGSSNPCRWRGKRLHHGGGVCLLFVLFVPSRLVVVTLRM
jgi:hypothetical protein